MPCDQVRVTEVTIEKCDKEMLIASAKELGIYRTHNNGYIYFSNGSYIDLEQKKIVSYGNMDVRAFKTAVIRNTVKANMQKQGFRIESVKAKPAQQQIKLY
jgi:hypothetical protein